MNGEEIKFKKLWLEKKLPNNTETETNSWATKASIPVSWNQ